MKFTISILILLMGHVHLTGQEKESCKYEVRGVIFDILTKEPLPFVTVRIEGSDIGTASAEDGSFELINLCEREYDLIFSIIGYKDLEHHHDFHHPEMQIYLAEQQYNLEGITVEAQRNEADLQSIKGQTISGEALERVKSESLGEIASLFTGVGTLNSGQNISKPIIHGLHSNRVLIVNNGVRHEFQNWGIDHAPEIDPSLSNQIEVVKGAGTVRFGPDALGGVLLLNPKKLELSTPLNGRVGLIGKTNGKSGEVRLGLEKGFKWLSLAVNASFLQQGDLKAPNYLLTNTGKVENSYAGRFRIHPSPHFDIEGYYSHVDQNLGILAGATFSNLDDIERALESTIPLSTGPFTYNIDQPRQEISHDLYKLTGKYIGEHQSVELRYGYQTNFGKNLDCVAVMRQI